MQNQSKYVRLGFIVSLCVIAIAGLVLILTVSIKAWSAQEALKWSMLVALGIGVSLLIVCSLFMFFKKMKEVEGGLENTIKGEMKEIVSSTERIVARIGEEPPKKKPTVPAKPSRKTITGFNTMKSEVKGVGKFYIICRLHAWIAFFLSVFFCLVGLTFLIVLGILGFENNNTTIIGLIVSGVSELFAGTALWVHRSAINQLNYYFRVLHNDAMFIAAINLIDDLDDVKLQNDTILKVIDHALKTQTQLPKDLAVDLATDKAVGLNTVEKTNSTKS